MVKDTNVNRGKILAILYILLVLGSLIGIYGQDISYYIMENIIDLAAEVCIILTTAISGALFILPPIIVRRSKMEIDPFLFKIYMNINALIGLIIMAFEIIVLAFWLS